MNLRLGALILVLTTSCVGGAPGQNCRTDDDCVSGEQCDAGECWRQCEQDLDCEDADACVDNLCREGGGECSGAAECIDGGARCETSLEASCVGGLCYCDDCQNGDDCADANPCTADRCNRGLCLHDAQDAEGDPCPVHAADDGVCEVVLGEGVCGLLEGATCLAHAECPGTCECTDATCATRVCASAPCTCRHGIDGACTTPLDDGVADPGDCEGDRACYGEACLLIEGEDCASDAECGQGHCECADAGCTTRACSPYDCPCSYLVSAVCGAYLDDGIDDGSDCTGAASCYQGACLLDAGEPCGADAECGTDECECTTNNCDLMVCALADCNCHYGVNGACTTPLLDGPTDPLDCPVECKGGVCGAALGDPCTDDDQCAQGECECTNDTCTVGACHLTSCVCHYGPGGDCSGVPLVDGAVDIGDCFGEFACSGGACMLSGGATCTRDIDCGPGQCECTDPTCTTRACTSADCDCGFGIDGACTGSLDDGVEDPDDCEGTAACWNGACGLPDGAPCTTHAECLGTCECVDVDCLARVCAPAPCLCGYGTLGACTDDLADGIADPGDCVAPSGCYAGDCLFMTGATCEADLECGSGHCECAEAECASRACADADCLCGWGPLGACTDPLNDGFVDVGDCDTPNLCQAGVCAAPDGSPCGAPEECQSGACELGLCAPLRCTPAAIAAVPYSGTGTALDPFVICSVDQFVAATGRSGDWASVFVLGADLDLDAITPVPMGSGGTDFLGTFDGRGYTLRNMHQDGTSDVTALFSTISTGGVVRNLNLENVDIVSDGNLGGVLARVVYVGATVENVTATGVVQSSSQFEFGFVGAHYGLMQSVQVDLAWSSLGGPDATRIGVIAGTLHGAGTIRDAHASGSIACAAICDSVGGLVGHSFGLIEDSSAAVDITGVGGNYIGGLVGFIEDGSATRRSHASGSVTMPGGLRVGGLLGVSQGSAIEDVYATGAVSGHDDVGGLVGVGSNGTLARVYATGAVHVTSACCGVEAGGGLIGWGTPAFDGASNSFAVGPVTSSIANVLGGLIGDNVPAISLNDCYWFDSPGDDAVLCTNGVQIGPPECITETDVSVFYDSAHPVYATWDFTTVWQANPGAMPTLRP